MATIEPYSSKSGRLYRVRYRKPDNSQTSKRGFKTKREAELFLASVEVSKAVGTYIDPTQARATVGRVGDAWLRTRTSLKPSSIAVMESAWRLHVRTRWGATPIGNVRVSDIEAWVAELYSPPSGKPMSASLVHRCHGLLVAVLDVAVKDRMIASNPARGVPLPRKQSREHRYLTHQQVFALSAAAGNHSPLVKLLAYTGLRWGEAAGLRIRDVDIDRRRLWVRQNAVRVGGLVVFGTPKTHKQRTVPFPEFLAGPIAAAMAGKHDDDLLFSGRFGEPLITPTVRENSWFDKALAAAELPTMTIHDLRHTAASLAISAGANVKAVQKMLGHASAAMTLDVYADLFDDDLDEVATRLHDIARASVVSKMWPETQSDRKHVATKRQKSPGIRASSEGGTRTRDTTIMSRVL
jgi:integrase